jgi:hypothetical protein
VFINIKRADKNSPNQAVVPYTIRLQVTDTNRKYFFYDGTNPPSQISLDGKGATIRFQSIDPGIGMS